MVSLTILGIAYAAQAITTSKRYPRRIYNKTRSNESSGMRRPSVRNPRSIWDIFAVVGVYIVLEYLVLQTTGSFIVLQELIIIAIPFVLWMMWAILRILSISSRSDG